jgi:hypothetical protein
MEYVKIIACEYRSMGKAKNNVFLYTNNNHHKS